MSTPSTPLQPLAVSEANISIRLLFRWFRERVDTLSTIHLRGVEAQDAKERFEELQRHAGVLRRCLRTVGRWMDVEVVQVVIAIIVAVEHQVSLLNKNQTHAPAPFIGDATDLEDLITYLRGVETHWTPVTCWARSREGKALLAEAEDPASVIRAAMWRLARSTCSPLDEGEESPQLEDIFADIPMGQDGLEDDVGPGTGAPPSLKNWLVSLGLRSPPRFVFDKAQTSSTRPFASSSCSAPTVPDICVWIPPTEHDPDASSSPCSSTASSTVCSDSPGPKEAHVEELSALQVPSLQPAIVLRQGDRDEAQDPRRYSTPAHPLPTSPTPSPDRTPRAPCQILLRRRRTLTEDVDDDDDDDDDKSSMPPKPSKRPRILRDGYAKVQRTGTFRYRSALTMADRDDPEPSSSSLGLRVIRGSGFRPYRASNSPTSTLRPLPLPIPSQDEAYLSKMVEEKEQSGTNEYGILVEENDVSMAELPAEHDEPEVEDDTDLSSYETADEGDWQPSLELDWETERGAEKHPVLEHASARASTPPQPKMHRSKGKAVSSRRCWDGIVRFMHHIFT
ncbi:hypothetical protein FKP32DRAFT_1594949 [Trametes sanguinea]|nr:hypothetical protein FKP32DRAFT_1594949 [Trametes sanguinea]